MTGSTAGAGILVAIRSLAAIVGATGRTHRHGRRQAPLVRFKEREWPPISGFGRVAELTVTRSGSGSLTHCS